MQLIVRMRLIVLKIWFVQWNIYLLYTLHATKWLCLYLKKKLFFLLNIISGICFAFFIRISAPSSEFWAMPVSCRLVIFFFVVVFLVRSLMFWLARARTNMCVRLFAFSVTAHIVYMLLLAFMLCVDSPTYFTRMKVFFFVECFVSILLCRRWCLRLLVLERFMFIFVFHWSFVCPFRIQNSRATLKILWFNSGRTVSQPNRHNDISFHRFNDSNKMMTKHCGVPLL